MINFLKENLISIINYNYLFIKNYKKNKKL